VCGLLIAFVVLAAIISAVLGVSAGWGIGIAIALLVVAGIVQARKPQTTRRTAKTGLVFSTVCPACRKHNKSGAKVCRYCRTPLEVPIAPAAQPVIPAAEPRPTKTCPDCAETILEAARRCRYCGHDFTDDAATGQPGLPSA
jgi:predicted amidophosphoribosyltransferase